jgi:hypothetical protein
LDHWQDREGDLDIPFESVLCPGDVQCESECHCRKHRDLGREDSITISMETNLRADASWGRWDQVKAERGA